MNKQAVAALHDLMESTVRTINHCALTDLTRAQLLLAVYTVMSQAGEVGNSAYLATKLKEGLDK